MSTSWLLGQTNTYTGANNGSWNTAGNWSLGVVPTAAHNVVITHATADRTVIINANAVCNSLTLNQGARNITLNVNGYTLTITGDITMNAPTANNRNTTLNIGSGTVNCQTITGNNSGDDRRDNKIAISTGNLTVTGNIAMNNNANRNDITFSGNGTITAGGNLVTGTLVGNAGTINIGGSFNPTVFTQNSSTVNYNNAGVQNVSAYTYYNLTVSGSGDKTNASTAFSVTNDLTIAGGNLVLLAANANYTVGNNLTVNIGGTLTHSVSWDGAGTLISVGGNMSIAGTYDYSAVPRAHIRMTGAGTRDISTGTSGLSILTLLNGDFRATGPVTVNDNFWSMLGTGGSFSTNGQTVDANASLLINGGTVNINGGTLNVTGGISAGIGGLNGALTISSGTLNTDGLTLGDGTRTGTVTHSGGTANINGILFINPSCSYTCSGSPQINITGNFTNNGAFTSGGETISFNGTSSQTIGGSSGTAIYNLNINNSAGAVLSGNLTITNTLDLASGSLSLGSGNSNLIIDAGGTVTGPFDNNHMIVCDGSGSLRFYNNTVPGFIGVYPVGTGTNYTPFEITSLTGSLTGGAGSRYIDVRAIAGTAPDANPTDLEKFWVISTMDIDITNADLSFAYVVPDEVGTGGSRSAYMPFFYDGVGWSIAGGASAGGENPMTVTGTSTISGTWTGREGPMTLYSYQSGAWSTATTWTTDPSGTLQIGNHIPAKDGMVIVLTDRTVTLTQDVAEQGLSVIISSGAFIDQSVYSFNETLSSLSGQGTLRLASANLPVVTTNTLVNAGGGTVEYYNASDFILPVSQSTYNNLTINTSSATATQMSNITLNGNLYVMGGTLRINDNTSPITKSLTINGNVTVDNGASVRVGNGVTNTAIGGTGGTSPYLNYYLNFHTVIIKGNFTNNGAVRFTNLLHPVYNAFPPTTAGATTGAASVWFEGASDNILSCNGPTDFYNLILNKGIDQTYSLTITSSAYSNFRLFGANTLDAEAVTGNPTQRKSLWVYSGTLVLKGSLIIPSLSEGSSGNSFFYIPSNGALVADGVDVVIQGTADDYREVNLAYGVSAAGNAAMGVNTTGSNSALYVFGKLQVNNGFLSTKESGGIITSSTASGQVIINGGTVDAKQFLSSTGSASFSQSGGLFLLRGRFQRTPAAYTSVSNLTDISSSTLNTTRVASGTSTGFGTFNLENAANIFSVSGGTIRIYDVTTTGIAEAFDVKSSTANINVTGGTVEFIPTTGSGTNATDFAVHSTAPLYNFVVNRTSSPSVVRMSTALTLKNNLNIVSGVLNANNLNLTVGGNFAIEAGTSYNTGTNITTFNGSGAQTFSINLAAALSLSSLTVEKPAGAALTLAGSQNTVNVSSALRLITGTLNDSGKTINVAGSVFNSGVATGTGAIVLNGTSAQTIDGGGVFGNISLANTAASPVTLLNRMTVNGNITFAVNNLLNIGTYNLHLNPTAALINSSAVRFIQTSGNAGDGGLSRSYSSNDPFVFPVGVAGRYTPATIGFTASPATYGSVTVVPVDYEHPVTTVDGQSLSYFWRVFSSGFTGIPLYSVTHSFEYSNTDIAGTEANYVPALYDGVSFSWYTGQNSDINITTNTISDWSVPTNSTNFLDADYTAGSVASFGTPRIFYSRQSGLWSSTATWSLSGHSVDNPPTAAPGANDIVIIGDNDSVWLATEIPPLPINDNNPAASYYQRNKASVNCATLQIEAGSVLDLQNNPGSTFASVLSHPDGNGKIRITTRDPANFDLPEPFVYPGGDFSEFSVNDGISEFYTINPAQGMYHILPSNASEYGTVILTPLRGSNIILPNLPLVTINGDLICNGSDADAWLAVTWNGEYGAIVAKTVNVKGDLVVAGGSFGFIYNTTRLQTVNIDGDIYVSPGTGIDIWASSTANIMSVGGSIYNNSNNTTAPYGTPSLIRFLSAGNKCDVIFTGNRSSVVTNNPAISTTPVTIFNKVTINKGNSPDTTVTWSIGGTLTTPTNDWLTLQNGTLVYGRTGDFNISTTTDFTIPATAGLTLNTPSNVYISNNAGSEILSLNGRLRILGGGGNVYIGPAGNTANNADIEYSGSGASLMEIQSGNLFVNGQIRRPLATTNGILAYRQSGGNVIIYGNNASATKAKLEVLNAGSEFTMSGGILAIIRGGGTTFGDLYLRPASGSVTGGAIVFSQTPPAGTAIDADQSYLLDAGISLNNLAVAGKIVGTNYNAALSLMISPLVLDGSLTISNNMSFFASAGRNVTIRGDLNNSGVYDFGTNRTIFDGGAQAVTGSSATHFYDMEVSSLTSLTVNSSFTINRDLDIISGNLVLGSALATLLGNLTNNGAFTDDNVTGGIMLGGTTLQALSGTGSFARLVLDNIAGARINNDIALQHDLEINSGVLDINRYQLTLSQNSLIQGTGFGSTKMIKSDGVSSSRGVLKFFPTGAQDFTFPVGVSGKYTPARFTVTSSATVGSIRINPVNECHPSVTDPLNSLGYYWQAESSGISGFNASLHLSYLSGDVSGDESSYVAARLVIPGSTWNKALPGAGTDNVNEASNTITFNYTSSGNLDGDYTAGTDTAIPDEVPEYITNSNGAWSDPSIWTPVGASPVCPAGGPRGTNVIIDHVVTTDINFISVLNTTINNELRVVAPTYGHNLGYVSGDGKLYLEGGNLPGGTYTDFTECSGNATIEYGGTGSYIIVSGVYTSVPNLFFTGTGTRILPNVDLTVCKRLVIDGPVLDNSANSRKLIIHGTFERYNSGAFRSGTGLFPYATVSFAGSVAQSVGGPTGNFSGPNGFYNLEINNPAGLTVSAGGLIETANQLILNNGVISISSTGRLVLLGTSSAAVVPVGGSATSYVSGPLTKNIINGDPFIYPLGRGALKGHRFTLTPTGGGTVAWTAEYFSPNSTATSIAPPLEVSNTLEYWSVSSASASSARIKIGWDPQSELTPLMTVNGLADMRVAEYLSGLWTELPSVATGNSNTGEVETNGSVSISSTPADFTSATISGTLARASFTSFAPICGTGGIPLSFISFTPISLNYIISYTINGIAQPDITVTSLPFTLPANVPGVYRLTGFKFNSGTKTGVADPNIVTVYELPTTSNAGADQSLCGVSVTTLAGNNPGPHAGLWTVVSGAGGSFVNSVQRNTVFNGVLGVSYTLRWTISNGPCSSFDEVVISFPVVASRPGDFTSAETAVCRGGTGYVYTVPLVSGVTYNWSYTGTGHTINGSGNSVTVDFNAVATGGTLSVTATNACGTSSARSVDITVRVASFAYTGSPYCQNGTDPTPVIDPGGVAGTFSSSSGLVFVNTATGQIDLSATRSGTYTVTNTVAIICGGLTATATVTVAGETWDGSEGSAWDNPANWSCGFVPYTGTDILIPDVSTDPVIGAGITGEAANIVIESGGSLTVTGGTIRIAGSVVRNGTFDVSDGTAEFCGSSAQIAGNGIFSGNTVRNLTVNNNSGVFLQGPLNVRGVVLLQNGDLASDGHLTLQSDVLQTALIDGSGTGNVTGNVTMQRYLAPRFGYKYFSSPFTAATVAEFGDDMDLASSFPMFYRYDESRTSSGWVAYSTGTAPLVPLEGYAVNFGALAAPGAVDVSGEVNNGSLSATVYNHGNLYTDGFNLVGNPYPSPVNWNAAGWTKTNIDNAVYYFRASTTDEYGGSYSSYVNGVSSDGQATNIIPSMQGFLVHVTDGPPTVTGTLGVTNSVRVNDLTHPFLKSADASDRFLLRMTATYTDDLASADPLVIYFDDTAEPAFDPELDALKLFNTDMMVANFYSVLTGGRRLSVNALPLQSDTALFVPLGLTGYRDGEVYFRIRDMENLPENVRIVFSDAVTGANINMLPSGEYRVNLQAGDYNNRFRLAFLKNRTGADDPPSGSPVFSAYGTGNIVKATVWTMDGNEGQISVYDMNGSQLFVRKVFETGRYDLDINVNAGVYIVEYTSGDLRSTVKMIIGL